MVPNDDTVVNEFYYWIGNDKKIPDDRKEARYKAIDDGMKSPDSRANLYYEFFVNQIAFKTNPNSCSDYAADGSQALCLDMQKAVPNYQPVANFKQIIEQEI